MKELVIVGAGGMGRVICDLSLHCAGYQREYILKGFLDYSPTPENSSFLISKNYPPLLNSINNYSLDEKDVFVCSTGKVEFKIENVNIILQKGGEFISLIHPSAQISSNAIIGKGCIIGMNSIIAADAKIGDYSIIMNGVVVGHDSIIGNFCRIDNNAVIVGGAVIKDEVTIHTSAVINNLVEVGKGSTIGALSFIFQNVPEYATLFGNPPRRLK